MDKTTFLSLMEVLDNHLDKTIHIDTREQVMMFLYIVGNHASNRMAAERFQHSKETVSRYFNKVARALHTISEQFIKQPGPETQCPPEIASNSKRYPWFKDCIGAINGTHIQAIFPHAKHDLWRDRKGFISQNILAGCSFNLMFTFVFAGF
jgi:hypothetical protein